MDFLKEVENKRNEIIDLVKNYLKELEKRLRVVNVDFNILQIEFAVNDDIKYDEELILMYDSKIRSIIIKHFLLNEKEVKDVTYSTISSKLFFESYKGSTINKLE